MVCFPRLSFLLIEKNGYPDTQSPRACSGFKSQVLLLAKPSHDPITRQAGKTSAGGPGPFYLRGGLWYSSSEWPARERKQMCILGQHEKAGAKQHACFITRREEEATIRTRRIVKQWSKLDLTGKRWRPTMCKQEFEITLNQMQDDCRRESQVFVPGIAETVTAVGACQSLNTKFRLLGLFRSLTSATT